MHKHTGSFQWHDHVGQFLDLQCDSSKDAEHTGPKNEFFHRAKLIVMPEWVKRAGKLRAMWLAIRAQTSAIASAHNATKTVL